MLPGTSALEYAFVGGLSIGCAMIIAPLATYLAHRISPRFVLNLGTLLETLSLITTSFVKADWQLFLSQGVCFGFGMGLCFCGSVGISSHWFKKRRSLVNGIASAGSGVGGLVYSLAVGKMIPELGFPWAMRILGILCFVVNIICANLLRLPVHSQVALNGRAFRLSLLGRLDFLLLISWTCLSGMGYVCLLFSLPSYSVAMGLTQQQGSLAGALLNLGQAIGRPAVGLLSDRLGRVNVAFASSLASGILSLVLWVFAGSVGLTYFFAIAVGLFSGTFLAAAAPITAEVIGLEDLGAGLGILWFLLGPPTAVAEVIALQLRDSPSDPKPYLRVQIYVGFMYIGSATCLAWLWYELRKSKVALGIRI
jgi:MFS family permease